MPISSYRAFKYSSLYPYYFTIQHQKTKPKLKPNYSFKLYNIGTENDEFLINYYTLDNKKEKLVFSKIENVLAEKNKTINTNTEKLKFIPIYKIEIVSKAPPLLFQFIYFQINCREHVTLQT